MEIERKERKDVILKLLSGEIHVGNILCGGLPDRKPLEELSLEELEVELEFLDWCVINYDTSGITDFDCDYDPDNDFTEINRGREQIERMIRQKKL